jgi:hypothetical protein
MSVLDVTEIGDPTALYVRDGAVVPRPAVDVIPSGPKRFAISPPSYSLTVKVNDVTVFVGSDDAGTLDLTGSQPGTYSLQFSAAFPWLPTAIEVTL